MSDNKYTSRVDRLDQKISMSKTTVPGFITGLSGTDSIVSFAIMYDALKRHHKHHRLMGVHYANKDRKKPTWFEEHIVPWMKERFPYAVILVKSPIGGFNTEELRWADLNIRSRYCLQVDTENPGQYKSLIGTDDKKHHWIAANINATEKRLGKYTILAKSASIWPIATLWKTDILRICEALEVPPIAMEYSRQPDCMCGRDELASENIELIDQILKSEIDPTQHDPVLLKTLFAWIKDIKREYDFKERTPYLI